MLIDYKNFQCINAVFLMSSTNYFKRILQENVLYSLKQYTK